LAVGYKTNSKTAIEFRKWATKTLRAYITDGFAINRKRITSNYTQFLNVVTDIKKLLPNSNVVDVQDVLELISLFADTWLSLDAYDKGQLPKGKLTKKKVSLTAHKIQNELDKLKIDLVSKSQATDIFGSERNKGSLEGIIGNVMQSFDGKDVYSTIEEKAAHLLYFIVKNHPFVDGNKRSGAFVFVWFLKHTQILDISKITPSALTALAILVASSDPKDKEKTIGLILSLISRK
jgi:prophage maintenance system killer protein